MTATARGPGPSVILDGLSKEFYAMDLGDVWRVMFRRVPRGESFTAVSEVTFDVPKGEFLGILGHNGAGKSTLLRTVGGVYEPTRGIAILSENVLGLYEFGVGGHAAMTGRQFATRWLTLSGLSYESLAAAVRDVEDFCELDIYFDKPVRTYSTGMRARLYFGTITAANAKIILIDEILSVGDEYFNAKCLRRLRAMLKKGSSGILASHDWAAILRMCSKAIVLDHGRVVDSGNASDVVRRYLQLSPLTRESARFGDLQPSYYTASGENLTLRIPIESAADAEILFGLSVEQFRKDTGWEHILLFDNSVVARGPGKYTVRVDIPKVPLLPGEYVLGLYLNVLRDGSIENADSRSWTTGDPLRLIVRGDGASPGTYLEMIWTTEALP